MKTLVLGILLVIPWQLFAQKKTLTVGDTMPALTVKILENGKVVNKPLREYYKDQHLILSFWATWCGSCMISIRETDSLINKEKLPVRLLPVTYEKKEQVAKFVTVNRKLKGLKLDYGIEDNEMMGYLFRFKSVPHEVWVDKEGVIKAITYPEDINLVNMQKFYMNEALNIKIKADKAYRPEMPFPMDSSILTYRTVFTKYNEEYNFIKGSLAKPFSEKENRFFTINGDMLGLYLSAFCYNQVGKVPSNRYEIQTENRFALMPSLEAPKYGKEITKKDIRIFQYCFDLFFSEEIPIRSFYSHLLKELNTISNFEGIIERKYRNAWILQKVSGVDVKKSTTQEQVLFSQGMATSIKGKPVTYLSEFLNWYMDTIPVINKTGIKDLIDVDLDIEINEDTGLLNSEKINSSLRKVGLEIIKQKDWVDVLVIRDK
jgi:thiol-disulfide isomerase/thioredoxin